jgi:hypothetical protein
LSTKPTGGSCGDITTCENAFYCKFRINMQRSMGVELTYSENQFGHSENCGNNGINILTKV